MSILDTERPGWLLDGRTAPACAGRDPELWFPSENQTGTEAKAVCFRCPALEVCREYAIPIAGLEGIWGGLSRLEQAAERRRRSGTCLCGHDAVDHVRRWRTGHPGRCKVCDCAEHSGID